MSQRVLDHLPYRFTNPDLLAAALTHPSRQLGQKKASDYERLEFLGDRILSLVIAEWLYELHPEDTEGSLAKRHAALVNRDCLARVAEGLHLEEDLRLVNPDDLQRGRVNILSDALEALIGAIYRDAGEQGLPVLRQIIRTHWHALVSGAVAVPQDAKGSLQEWAQARGLPLPHYELAATTGPAHAPRYTMRVSVEGQGVAEGEGASKREAEKKAAAILFEKISAS